VEGLRVLVQAEVRARRGRIAEGQGEELHASARPQPSVSSAGGEPPGPVMPVMSASTGVAYSVGRLIAPPPCRRRPPRDGESAQFRRPRMNLRMNPG
jgi:hypothetical protein